MYQKETDKKIINYDIDSILLDDESRKINEYFNIYKISALVCGSSGSGKTSFLIKLLLNKIIEFDAIILVAPMETLKSGIYKNFINKYTELFGDNKIMFCFNLSKEYKGLDEYKKIADNVLEFEGLPIFDDIFELKKELNINKNVIIFDDFISLLNRKQWQIYYEYLFNSSRLNSYIFSLTQSGEKFPPYVRANFSVLILFVNYLTLSNIKALIKNTINIIITNEQLEQLIDFIKHSENKHEPLILVGSSCPQEKKIIYDNHYINFD